MGDQRIASKNFNPYDLGSVARATKESRAINGQYRVSQPYTPPRSRQDEVPSTRSDGEPGKVK
jgi:hypothetical protein